ncbi:DUF262 domain-containing protein [Acidaminobacter sp. JC074]|uniref:DUF262 domain-containing protein n=1 Tax=Acidaminobacter sp. JC074 TaxID=2530199 RepID=UPI001F0F9BD7|nr:DUF262 domain-containing protein [Acidaminobacter sp. JC074]MCH4891121.1 DUF262 domain-containing protein [Acidaminobacter sp. JC074]
MQDQFAVNNKCFSEIMKNRKAFIVSKFQRSYSWGENQWHKLWQDIRITKANEEELFLGSIMTTYNDTEDVFYLVDGQQRLLTISILILCIVEKYYKLIDYGLDVEKNKTEIESLYHNYLLYEDSNTNTKMGLNEINQDFYFENLINLKAPKNIGKLHPSNRSLYNCFNFYSQRIDIECKWLKDTGELGKLLDHVVNKLFFIDIHSKDINQTYIIMDALKNNGIQTAITDSLKIHIFDLLKASDKKKVNNEWQEIIKMVSTKGFPLFLKHYLQTCKGSIQDETLFEVLRDTIKTRDDGLKLIHDLYHLAPFYGALTGSNLSYVNEDDDIVKSINELKLFGILEVIPLLLSVYKKKDPALLKEVLKMCATIVFRYAIIGAMPTNKLEPVINETALLVNQNKLTNSDDIFKKIKHLHIDKEQFKNSFKRRSINTNTHKELVSYILIMIENKLSDASYSYFSNDAIIEHTLPESPSNHWKVNFHKDHIDDYIYRLGNLTLLETDLHKETYHQYFKEKKTIYDRSHYQISHTFTMNNWDPATLEKRQLLLAKVAEEIWRYEKKK